MPWDDWLWNTVTGMISESIDASQLDDVMRLLTFNGNFDYNPFWEIVNELLDVMRPFGFAMITTWFLIHMFDAASKDQITIDSIIKTLIQLVLAVGLIGNIDMIVNAFLSITETMLSGVSDLSNSNSLSASEIVDMWKENDPSGVWGALLSSIVIWILAKVSTIAVNFAALSRMLEIAWRIVFAPIGCSNVFEGGVNSPGIKYLKSLFATIVSAVALYAIIAIGFSLCSTFITSGGNIVTNGGDIKEMENSLVFAMVSLLATAGAAIGVSNKIKEVVG